MALLLLGCLLILAALGGAVRAEANPFIPPPENAPGGPQAFPMAPAINGKERLWSMAARGIAGAGGLIAGLRATYFSGDNGRATILIPWQRGQGSVY